MDLGKLLKKVKSLSLEIQKLLFSLISEILMGIAKGSSLFARLALTLCILLIICFPTLVQK